MLRIGILITKVHSPVMRNTLLLTDSEVRFISENGIVAVFGDENQLVTWWLVRRSRIYADKFAAALLTWGNRNHRSGHYVWSSIFASLGGLQ